MGLLGSLFSAAADIAKETITETMNQNETEKFIKIMLKSCSPINIMRVFISSKMLRLQFIGMKKQQTKAASTLCIGPDTFITPNQSTTTKLVSGSHSPQKRETKMPKKFCAII